jgi:RNA polymerase sigma factor (sigma-70 family)
MLADSELVAEILSGSQPAMEILVRRHYRPVFDFVYRKTGDYHAACDLTQEVFVKMMRSLGGYREIEKFRGWLLTIAVNCCRDYHRAGLSRTGREEALTPDLAGRHDNVWDIFSRKAARERVKEAVQSLPALQKEVILLRFYHDLKIREIAGITGSKEPTVKSRLRQALEKLRHLLAESEADLYG